MQCEVMVGGALFHGSRLLQTQLTPVERWRKHGVVGNCLHFLSRGTTMTSTAVS